MTAGANIPNQKVQNHQVQLGRDSLHSRCRLHKKVADPGKWVRQAAHLTTVYQPPVSIGRRRLRVQGDATIQKNSRRIFMMPEPLGDAS